MSKTATEFMDDFCEALDDDDDEFFISFGNDEEDMEAIKLALKTQGYWSGERKRYFFDLQSLEENEIKLLTTEKRK